MRRLFQLAGEQRHFIPTHAALQHVHAGNAENNDEIFADRGATTAHDFKRKPHTVFI